MGKHQEINYPTLDRSEDKKARQIKKNNILVKNDGIRPLGNGTYVLEELSNDLPGLRQMKVFIATLHYTSRRNEQFSPM